MCFLVLLTSLLLPTVVGGATYNPSCLDNYGTWPQSDTRNTGAPWSLGDFTIFPAGTFVNFPRDYGLRQFIDLNGDGLLDFVYYVKSLHNDLSANNSSECVLLNNGQGWDIAYRCVVTRSGQQGVTYYGDCADTGA